MRFNTVQIPVQPNTVNLAGGDAFTLTPKQELLFMVLTSFVTDQFYRSVDTQVKRLSDLMDRIEPEFSAKLALYARHEFNLRSISHVMARFLAAKNFQGKRAFFSKIVRTPEDILEIVGLYAQTNPKATTFASAMKRGFADAMLRFDEYQMSKYSKSNAQKAGRAGFALKDILRLVHPRETEAIRKLAKDELEVAQTHERIRSAIGSSDATEEEKGQARVESWEKLIRERKIGYLALLRNLRKIAEEAPHMLFEASNALTDKNFIKKSGVLPFQFLNAYEELKAFKGDGKILRTALPALSQACDICVTDCIELEGDTIIAVDASGSMDHSLSSKGVATRLAVACLAAAVLYKKSSQSLITIFDTNAEIYGFDPNQPTLALADSILITAKAKFGGGTDFSALFAEMLERSQMYQKKEKVRVVILSDMQSNIGELSRFYEAFKRQCGAPILYSIDLAGYGTSQFSTHNIYAIAGFSDKIFSIMTLLEEDRSALLRRVESVTL